MVYLDLRKVFDIVPHNRLLLKLEAHRITGEVLDWIKCFLSNRKLNVGLTGTCSDKIEIWSGVPKGSVLGLILFLVYIHGLPDHARNQIKMFAHDAKAYSQLKSVDARGFQQDLKILSSVLSRDWLMELNGKECKRMHLGAKNHKFVHSLLVHNNEEDSTVTLDEKSEEKDLGVLIISSLSVNISKV